MAARDMASSASTLRAVTYRLTSTPSKQLPKVAAQVSAALWNCRTLLSTPTDTKQTSEAATAVHRFKTQISTLLQDRTVEGRWAAVVLVKAAIEAGGLDTLAKASNWVRSLLGILKKPDPPSTRTLAVMALTRIFMLTWDHSNLVREITTPTLTTFVPTCIANIENKRCSARELEAVLESFATLLPRHPTIFRTHESKLRAFLTSVLSASSIDSDVVMHSSNAHKAAARRLLVLLHNCTPKQGASDKWDEGLKATVIAAHATCDRIFRAVHEDWQSTADIIPSLPQHSISNGDVEYDTEDAAGLRSWKGIYAGSERVISLLLSTRSYIATSTSGAVSFRLGLVADLLTRVFGVTVPQPGKQDFIKLNNQISRDEREALFAVVPVIHSAAAQLALAILDRLDTEAFAWAQCLVDQVCWVFQAESFHAEVRATHCRLVSRILALLGPTMTKNEVLELEKVIKSCCEELLPETETSGASFTKPNGISGDIKQQLGFADSSNRMSLPTDTSELKLQAAHLLRTVLSRLDTPCISLKLRAQIDRTAVLIRDKDMLLASTLSPPRKQHAQRGQASLLPILAREFTDASDVEALLRPRLPPIIAKGRIIEPDDVEEEEEEEEEEDGDEDNMEVIDEQEPEPEVLNTSWEESNQAPAEGISNIAVITNGKRKALGDEDSESSAKRLRSSPVAEGLLPDSANTLPGPSPSITSIPAVISPDVPNAQVGGDVQSTVVIATSAASSNPAAMTTHGADVESDDDSDFEMPPLTMEPDTDPEDAAEAED